MGDLGETILQLVRGQADAAGWMDVLAPDASHETLHATVSGRDAVADLLGKARFAHLSWERLDRPGLILTGTPAEGSADRGAALTITERDGMAVIVAQQNLPPGAPSPGTPMAMDDALRTRINDALADKHAMYIVYVDPAGRPHMSQRGSIRAIAPDALAIWARYGSGLTRAVATNPHVALYFRDEIARATYNIAGRARVVEDEAFRERLFAEIPVVEQRHDFARLGAAILIELDLVEGYAGFTPTGLIDPVKLVRRE